MKQFPYVQQIIWENNVEQIEWVEEFVGIFTSEQYVAKCLPDGYLIVGNWRRYDEDDEVRLITPNADYEVKELECWTKL